MKITIVILASALALSGCGLPGMINHEIKKSEAAGSRQEGYQKLTIGMPISEAEMIFGKPRKVTPFKGGATSSGVEELRHYTNGGTIGYINNKVASWG